MLKRTYGVVYRVRPNKKTEGVRYIQNMIFRGKLKGNQCNQTKLMAAICSRHRVNADAIVIEEITLMKVRLAIFEEIANVFSKPLVRFGRSA